MTCVNIDVAYTWLKEGGTHLEASTKDLLAVLEQQIRLGGSSAWQSIKLLETISLKLSDHMECADILSECGYAAYRLGNYEEALRYFHQAIRKYHTAHHQIAMVEWMVGWVEWHSPGGHGNGFVDMRGSIDKFEVLGKHAALGVKDVAWYREHCREMRDSLDYLIKTAGVAGLSSSGAPVSSTLTASGTTEPVTSTSTLLSGASGAGVSTSTPPSPSSTSTTTVMPNEKDRLRVYGVAAKVPAGGWGVRGFDAKSAGAFLEVPYVFIEDKLHIVKNLRREGGKTINLLEYDHKYVVIQITGDSMNLAGIDKGDYVLLRQQNNAQNGDIVVAELVGMEGDDGTLFTLKRYISTGKVITLVPVSDKDEYQELTIPHDSTIGSHICGVAYAVFKPAKQ